MHTTRPPTGTRRALLLWLLAAGATLLPRAGFAQQCTLGSFATVACTRLLERTLVLRADTLTPLDGLSTARTRQVMGATAEAAHDPGRAREMYESALAILERLAPGTSMEAETLQGLGRVRRAQGALQEGADRLKRAVDIVEDDARHGSGDPEGPSGARATHAGMYRDLVVAELELGRAGEALHVVERSRGGVLLEWLARRRVAMPDDVPPEVRREGEDLDAERERVQPRLQGLSPSRDAVEIDRLVGQLRDLHHRRELWKERVRECAPHYAALQYPVALDAPGVAAALDPGTVLLSYVVGPESTRLFVLAGGQAAPRVYTIPAGADALQRRVADFRRLIRADDPAPVRALRRQGRALFDLLMAPAEAEIGAAARVLISPDGPLHALPFGALSRKKGYVVEWRPFHLVNSVTLYAELRRGRRPLEQEPARLMFFGDPRPGPGYARRFAPLPGSRREARAIAREFPRSVESYLGAAATEGLARRTGGALRAVHFATHATIDERLPLDSGLVLSPGPGKENGLLQAWEIFDGVRFDADLVTLSGCETAVGGEGLMGLTRAFLYAGARSVLASLWGVSDFSTPELMDRFYRHLAAGAAKDEALRAAQVEMIRAGGRRAQPDNWAAFELFGDWR